MRHKLFATLFLLASLLLTGSAFADTVNMLFQGPSGNQLGGVYTYPYNFSINGGPTVGLLCDAFNNDITTGESWTATVNTIASAGTVGLFSSDSDAVVDYKEAGLIFDSVLGVNGTPLGAANSNDANWAIWAVFADNALNDIKPGNASSPFGVAGDPAAYALYLAAVAAAPTASVADFAGITVYTPLDGTQVPRDQGDPQEFMGYGVSESSTLSLMGILLLTGVGGFTFRKRLTLNLAVGQ